MKKLTIIALSAILVLLSGCGADAAQGTDTSPTPSQETSSTVIADQDGVTVTYTGAKLEQYIPGQKDGYALYVGVTIDNTTDKDITIYPTDSSVNDVMKPALSAMPMNVLAGKKLVTSFFFTKLEDVGLESVDDISKVEKIEFKLAADNGGSIGSLFKTDAITVTP